MDGGNQDFTLQLCQLESEPFFGMDENRTAVEPKPNKQNANQSRDPNNCPGDIGVACEKLNENQVTETPSVSIAVFFEDVFFSSSFRRFCRFS